MGRAAGEATFSAMVAAWRDRRTPALISADGAWSGPELLSRAAGAADWLEGLGLPAGRPVPALLSTGPTALALLIGGAASGRPLAPLGPLLTPRELAACVDGLRAPVLVAEAAFADTARQVAGRTGCRVAVTGLPPSSDRRSDPEPAPDAVACVIHTSGTSGTPRPVPYRQDRLAARIRLNAALGSLSAGDRFTAAAPFHHVGGVGNLAVALGVGATTVSIGRFTVDGWRAAGRLGVTHALLVPTMVDRLLDEGALAFPSLRVLQYGGSPMHPETLRRAVAGLPGADLVQFYGQTEGSPITYLGPAEHRRAANGDTRFLGTVGRAVPGVELRIADAGGDGVGEVCARGPHLCLPDADGWLRTGDVGRLDGEWLHLVGRLGDRIVRGGENVHPLEVESVLATHPAVREAAVVGVPDVRWGEIIRAFVVPVDPAAPPDAAELRSWARRQLAGFKVPTVWTIVPDLPRNAAGKVIRRQLGVQYI